MDKKDFKVRVKIDEDTTKKPLTMIGKYAGICYNSRTDNDVINHDRGVECVQFNHGRTIEFPDVYMTIEDYSARVMREFYTHIGGAPTRLQESTRYVKYTKYLPIVVPPLIARNEEAVKVYTDTTTTIKAALQKLEALGIPKEDSAMLLPLGMATKVIVKVNARELINIARERMCTRAYWEFRNLMTSIRSALAQYSPEWKEFVEMTFKAKCDVLGYCPEKESCGRYPIKIIDKK